MISKENKKGNLTDLQKARLVVKFMNNRNQPLKNREFFEYFFSQQEKSEKIESYENVKDIVIDVLRQIKVLGLGSSESSFKSGSNSNKSFEQSQILHGNSSMSLTPDRRQSSLSPTMKFSGV
jgi:hypothetical protein